MVRLKLCSIIPVMEIDENTVQIRFVQDGYTLVEFFETKPNECGDFKEVVRRPFKRPILCEICEADRAYFFDVVDEYLAGI